MQASELPIGTKVEGTVTGIVEGRGVQVEVRRLETQTGAWTEIDPPITLDMRQSQISVDRVDRIADRLAIGDAITALVIGGRWDYDRLLSRREMELPEMPDLGTEVEGTVNRIDQIGAFVSVLGRSLLLPNAEIAHEFVSNARDYFKEGDTVQAVLIAGKGTHKYALSRRRLTQAPARRFANGTRVLGRVQSFWQHGGGAVVIADRRRDSDGGVVPLAEPVPLRLHIGEISDDFIYDVREKLQPDQEVEGRIIQNPVDGGEALSIKPVPAGWALEDFAHLGNGFVQALRKLGGEMAQTENEHWDFTEQPRGGYPILESYVKYTFAKVQSEGGIKAVGDKAAFHTGLMTEGYSAIYALFSKLPVDQRRQGWLFQGFYDEHAGEVIRFRDDPPRPADYFGQNDHHLVVYNRHLKLDPVIEHILKRPERLPVDLRAAEKGYQAQRLQAAIKQAEQRAHLNWKTAVAQWHEGRIQLLLPLRFTADQRRTDVALTVSLMKSPTGGPDFYRGSTILPLDWAYRYARVIARPDPEWLVPTVPFEAPPDEG